MKNCSAIFYGFAFGLGGWFAFLVGVCLCFALGREAFVEKSLRDFLAACAAIKQLQIDPAQRQAAACESRRI